MIFSPRAPVAKSHIRTVSISGFAVGIMIFTPAFAQDEFESVVRKELEEFQRYSEQVTAEFEAYAEAEREAFEEFKREIEEKWGEFKASTKKEWVEYSQDQSSRTSVDFEKGEVTVEVVIDEDEAKESDIASQKIQEAVTQVVNSRGKTKDYETIQEKPKPLSSEPVLEGQLKTKTGETVSSANAQRFAKEAIESSPPTKKTIKGKDDKKRFRFTITFSLVPNHVKIRAKKFEKLVYQYCTKYELSPSLVFAVIHTESSFNPAARSPVPAFGLMQLVPRSGARDAYNFVYEKDELVTANYLYKPQNNIELGAAFLHILGNRYLKDIQDPQSRQYCAIAAYNTGVGNVCRAFTGKAKINPAVRIINGMSSDNVYADLQQRLPYGETREYVERVVNRMKIYK